jgi:hypothetical protein
MKRVAACLPGLRIIRQDPWECLISFIFSSNNNIKRITKGLQLLRTTHGKYICSLVKQRSNSDSSSSNSSSSGWIVRFDLEEQARLLSAGRQPELATDDAQITGEAISSAEQDGIDGDTIHLFSFPSTEVFSAISEEQFREMG